jgi:hypothetical protein
MVEVIYDGNLGNNLFQYCFGRILAEKLGYKLLAKPIPGFPKTYDSIEGHTYNTERTLRLRGQKPDLTFINDVDSKYHLLLTGYFQRYEYYEEHTQSVRNWLAVEDNLDSDINVHDVVIGIRRGRDYIPRHGLPVSYYQDALASMQYDRVFICTNEPTDPFIQYFKKGYGAIIRPPGALDNLMFIKQFKKIIISNSTFLWWAAFLSDANEIVFPRPSNGLWSSNDPMSKNISLEVNTERYRYLNCEEYKSEFASEIMRNHYDRIISVTKARLRRFLPFAIRKTRGREKSLMTFNEDFSE